MIGLEPLDVSNDNHHSNDERGEFPSRCANVICFKCALKPTYKLISHSSKIVPVNFVNPDSDDALMKVSY